MVDNGLGTATYETEVIVVPATRLDALGWDDYLRVQINVVGEKDRAFRIYSSPDLEDWTLLTTVTNFTGNTLFHDPAEGGPAMRFYKAEQLETP